MLAEALKAEHAVAQMSTRAVANVAAGTVFHLPSDPNEDPPAILASSKECPPDGERALRFTIQVRVLKGLPGRQKVHTLELNQGIAGHCAVTRTPIAIAEPYSDPHFDQS